MPLSSTNGADTMSIIPTAGLRTLATVLVALG